MSLIANIKLLCKSKGTSIPNLEKELGFGRGAIYNWDKNSPSIDKVQKVASYFEISVDRFLQESNTHNNHKDKNRDFQGMEKMTHDICIWAVKRNLHLADPAKQTLKLGEEFGELCQGLAKGKPEQVKDSIGDMFVVLTILAMQLGTSINECTELAYQEIKDRKGKTINGVFVKETDLNLCPHGDIWDDCPDCRH